MGRGKKPVYGRGRGAATHNIASEPGELEVIIWGCTDREPDRRMAIVLDEEAVKRLVAALGRFGFYA